MTEPNVPELTGFAGPDLITRIFTFGYGHVCPFTGKGLGEHYATVVAPDPSAARTLMNATFGRMWAFEYDGPGDPRIAAYMPRMTEHARLVLGPAVADTGMDFSDLADRLKSDGAPVPTTTAGWANGDRSGALVEVHPAETEATA